MRASSALHAVSTGDIVALHHIGESRDDCLCECLHSCIREIGGRNVRETTIENDDNYCCNYMANSRAKHIHTYPNIFTTHLYILQYKNVTRAPHYNTQPAGATQRHDRDTHSPHVLAAVRQCPTPQPQHQQQEPTTIHRKTQHRTAATENSTLQVYMPATY